MAKIPLHWRSMVGEAPGRGSPPSIYGLSSIPKQEGWMHQPHGTARGIVSAAMLDDLKPGSYAKLITAYMLATLIMKVLVANYCFPC